MTPAQLIQRYIAMRDHVEARTKAFEAELEPYKSGMQAIEGAVSQHLIDTGAENIKTEYGTAYRTTTMSVRMADRETFIDFARKAPNGYDFFTSAIAKDAVKSYQESSGGAVPPGLDVVLIQKTNFRRS